MSDDEDIMSDPVGSPSKIAIWKAIIQAHSTTSQNNEDDSKAWCQVCKLYNTNGDLMKCCEEDCSRYIHIDCALQSYGGVKLVENILSIYCKNHFKRPIYCLCKKPFEDGVSMISCDSCGEWFHFNCIGLKLNSFKKVGYICDKCNNATSTYQLSKISELKESNALKEEKDTEITDAKRCLIKVIDLMEDAYISIDAVVFAIEDTIHINDIEIAKGLLKEYNILVKKSSNDIGDEDGIDLSCLLCTITITTIWEKTLTSFIRTYHEKFIAGFNNIACEVNEIALKNARGAGSKGYYKPCMYTSEYFIKLFGPLFDAVQKLYATYKTMEFLSDADITEFSYFYQSLCSLKIAYEGFEKNDIDMTHLLRIKDACKSIEIAKEKKTAAPYVGPCLLTIFSFARANLCLVNELIAFVTEIDKLTANTFSKRYSVSSLVENLDQLLNCGVNMATIQHGLEDMLTTARELNAQVDLALEQRDFAPLLDVYEKATSANLILSSSVVVDKLCTAERTLNELHLTEDSTSRYNVDYIMTCCTECERSLHMLGAEFHTPLVEQAIMLLQRDVALLNALLEAHDKVQANMSPLELDREDYWIEADLTKPLRVLEHSRLISSTETALRFAQELQTVVKELYLKVKAGETIAYTDLVTLNLELKHKLSESSHFIPNLEVKSVKDFFSRVNIKLNDLCIASESKWSVVRRKMDACIKGITTTHEDFTRALHDAIETLVEDVECLQNAQNLIQTSATFASHAEKYISTLDNLSYSEEELTAIHNLGISMSTLILPYALRDRISSLSDDVALLLKCQNVVKECHTQIPRRNDTIELHQLKSDVLKLTLESENVRVIIDSFVLALWRIDAASILRSDSALKSYSDLLDEAKTVQGACDSPEYTSLTNILQRTTNLLTAFDDFADRVDEAVIDVNALVESSQLIIGDDSYTEHSSLLQDSIMTCMDAAMDRWKNNVAESKLIEMYSDLCSQESTLKLSLPVKQEVRIIGSFLSVLPRVHIFLQLINDIIAQRRNPSDPTVTVTDLETRITLLTRCISAKPNFILLTCFLSHLKRLYSNSLQWEHDATAFFPSKFTRNSNKIDMKPSMHEVRGLLSRDFCRAIHTPSYESVHQIMIDSEEYLRLAIAMLLPDDTARIKDTIEIIKDPSTADSTRQSLLWDEIQELFALKDATAVTQIAIPELQILHWLYDVYLWMLTVPPIDYPLTNCRISYETAVSKITDGAQYVKVPPIGMLEILRERNLVVGDTLLHPSINPIIAYSKILYSALEKEIAKTEAIQSKVKGVVNRSFEMNTNDEKVKVYLQSLLIDVNTLAVRPLSSVKRGLELMLGIKSAVEEVSKQPEDPRLRKILNDHEGKSSRKEAKESVDMSSSSLKRQRLDTSATDAVPPKKEHKTVVTVSKDTKPVALSCARASCVNERTRTSQYCSDSCAHIASSDLLQAMVHYRSTLMNPSNLPSSYKPVNSISTASLNISDSLGHMLAGLTRAGYIANNDDSTPNLAAFQDILVYSDINRKEAYEIPMKTAMSKRVSGYTAFTPVLPKNALTILNPHITISTNIVHTEIETRNLVRFNLEEVLVLCMNRLNIYHAFARSIMIASEIEDELFIMYNITNTLGKKELSKKEYRKHHLMLLRNLKFTHNDSLIEAILNGDRTIAELLKMNSEELADPSTKVLRAANRENLMHASMIESRDGLLEEKRREAMSSREESWRRGDNQGAVVVDGVALQNAAKFSKDHLIGNSSSMDSLDSGMHSIDDDEQIRVGEKRYLDEDDATGSAMSAADETTEGGASNKFHRHDSTESTSSTSDPVNVNDEEVIVPIVVVPRVRPTKPISKGPSVLQLLKSSGESFSERPSSPEPVIENPSVYIPTFSIDPPILRRQESLEVIGPMKLINSNGGSEFCITRPLPDGTSLQFVAVGVTLDRRIHGLIRSPTNIDGRVKVVDVDKFLEDTVGRRTKHVVCFRIFVTDTVDSNSGYRKFCDEFTNDRKVGLSHLHDKDKGCVYIIPPALKRCLSILKNTEAVDPDRGLYAVVVTRENGPPHFVNGNHEKMDYPVPASPIAPLVADVVKNSDENVVHTPDSLKDNFGEVVEGKVGLVGLGRLVSSSQSTQSSRDVHSVSSHYDLARSASSAREAISTTTVNIPTNPIIASTSNASYSHSIEATKISAKYSVKNSSSRFSSVADTTVSKSSDYKESKVSGDPPAAGFRSVSTSGGNSAQMANRSSSTPAVASTVSNTSAVNTPAAAIVNDEATMAKIARFCAENGLSSLEQLKAKPTANVVMPFIFPGHPRFQRFNEILRESLQSLGVTALPIPMATTMAPLASMDATSMQSSSANNTSNGARAHGRALPRGKQSRFS